MSVRERVAAVIDLHEQREQPSPYSDSPPQSARASANSNSPSASTEATASSAFSILDAWGREGALVHEPTGIDRLDELTGGGPVYGSRWYVLGAPDAGKTAMQVQLADEWSRRGVVVGLLAVDEDPGDLLTRLMQRRGFTRAECEERSPAVLRDMQDRARDLEHVRLYDSAWTIERAGADLAKYAAGKRAALFVDSIQTAKCNAEINAGSIREAVTARTVAIRSVATRYRMITVATSEMARSAYRSVEAAEQSNDMAAAKESGAIEYSARVLLALRSVTDEPDLLELRIAKNKHGPANERFGLRIDRRLQTLAGADLPDEQDVEDEREARKAEHGRAQVNAAAAALARLLLDSPGLGTREVAGALRVSLGRCSTDTANGAIHALGAGLERRDGARGARRLYLVGRQVPEAVIAALDIPTRARVLAYQAPEVAGHG